jgi:hypothetical protein
MIMPKPTKVIEFKSKGEYEEWLSKNSEKIKVIDVSTTKRWSFWTGFLGDKKTYTVTYQIEEQGGEK